MAHDVDKVVGGRVTAAVGEHDGRLLQRVAVGGVDPLGPRGRRSCIGPASRLVLGVAAERALVDEAGRQASRCRQLSAAVVPHVDDEGPRHMRSE